MANGRYRTSPKHIDWPSAQAEYVNNAGLTHADIAAKYKCKEGTVRIYAMRHEWARLRQERANDLLRRVTQKSTMDAVVELARYNEQDLIAAKALRSQAAKKLQEGAMSAQDLRSLASTIESAQRIAHLALGAATELTGQVDNVDLTLLSDNEFSTLESLYAKANPRGTQASGCEAIQ